MKYINKFKNELFNDSLNISHRLLNLTLCATLIGGLFSLIMTSVGKLSNCALIIAAMIVIFVLLLWANIGHEAKTGKKAKTVTIILIIIVNFIVFPSMYFLEGGMHSGMPVWIVVGMVFDWLFLSGTLCYVMYGVNVIVFGLCIVIEMFYPDTITYIQSPAGTALDIFQSTVAVTCVFGVIFKYQSSVYEKQNNDLFEKELELIKANEELKRLNQAKSDFLANMSHEIRTPINAVLGMDEIILRENKDENIAKYAANIQSAGQNLLSLINDILDFSKIESGKMEIVPVTYELFSLMYDCYTMISLSAKEKNIEITVANDPGIPSKLYGDEVRIRQIISNLLSNAVKYTKRGSIKITFNWVNEELCISVKDTGIGIEKENIDKLFNTFERVDEKRNRNIEGTGLGLAITKSFVELMGGRISVESEYGKGSIFRVQIPQKPKSDVPMGRFSEKINSFTSINKKYKESFQAPDARILIVDDVKMNLDVMVGLLKTTKIQMDTALSGRICLEMIKDEKYDIIFMDHMMPELDGIETFHMIRADKTHVNQDTPIIALTANAIMGVEEEYLSEGFQDYLSKPVRGGEVESMLLKYLPKEKIHLVEKEPAGDENEYDNWAADDNKTESAEDIIARLTFLDTQTGLMYCADSPEMYVDILGSYVNSKHYEELCDNYEKEDWENYRIHMHAVKSTSLTIGAMEISGEAKEIEQSAKEQRWDDIKKKHDAFMQKYKALLDALQTVLG